MWRKSRKESPGYDWHFNSVATLDKIEQMMSDSRRLEPTDQLGSQLAAKKAYEAGKLVLRRCLVNDCLLSRYSVSNHLLF